jgi:hypothetical protein
MVGAHGAVPRPVARARSVPRGSGRVHPPRATRRARARRRRRRAVRARGGARARAAPQCARAPTANHYSQDSGTIVYNKVPGQRALHILIQLLPGRTVFGWRSVKYQGSAINKPFGLDSFLMSLAVP